MLAISLTGALFLAAVVATAIGLMAWLLSGSPDVVTRALRASATSATDDDAFGSGRQAPTLDARQAHRGQ